MNFVVHKKLAFCIILFDESKRVCVSDGARKHKKKIGDAFKVIAISFNLLLPSLSLFSG